MDPNGSTVPTLELTAEPDKPNTRQIWTHTASAVVAGAAVALYFTKYRTITRYCHITAEQVDFLKDNVGKGCVKFAWDTRHRVLVTMAPLPPTV